MTKIYLKSQDYDLGRIYVYQFDNGLGLVFTLAQLLKTQSEQKGLGNHHLLVHHFEPFVNLRVLRNDNLFTELDSLAFFRHHASDGVPLIFRDERTDPCIHFREMLHNVPDIF